MYVIEGLKPQTFYDFRFAATNDVGRGDWGSDMHETTPGRSVPQEPKIPRTSQTYEEYDMSPYSNQYELSWLPTADNGEPIDMYKIKYCQIRRDGQLLENTCRVTETQGRMTRYWLRGLSSDTFYRVELQAHNVMGFSKPVFARFKTARGKS